MPKDGVVLVIVAVVALGAILVWWTQVPTQSMGATAGSSTTGTQVQESEAAHKAAPVTVSAARIPKPVPAPAADQPSVVETIARSEVQAPPPVLHADPPPPFPVVEQIATGVRKDSITGKYGEPALSAVTLTGGHIVETFIYAQKRSRSATIIRLEDG